MDELKVAFEPIIKIPIIFGFWPFNVNPVSGKISPSKLKVSYAISIILAYFYLLYLHFNNDEENFHRGSILSRILTDISVTMTGVLYIVTLFVNSINRTFFQSHLKILYRVDLRVSF